MDLSAVQGETEQHSEIYLKINATSSARLARGLSRRRGLDKEMLSSNEFLPESIKKQNKSMHIIDFLLA